MKIAIVNQKGGTGKTTTSINIGRGLVLLGYSVLVIDLDPQANLSYSLGIRDAESSIKDVFLGRCSVEDALFQKDRMHILVSDINLSEIEMYSDEFSSPSYILSEVIETIQDDYDYVLIDCPPSISLLSTNALVAANGVLIPMPLDVFSLQGLEQIHKRVNGIKEEKNHDLEIIGILPSMVDNRKNLTKEVLYFLENNFKIPVFNNHIRTDVKAAEAPSFGSSVIDYDPRSKSAQDFKNASKELVERTNSTSKYKSKLKTTI